MKVSRKIRTDGEVKGGQVYKKGNDFYISVMETKEDYFYLVDNSFKFIKQSFTDHTMEDLYKLGYVYQGTVEELIIE